MALNNEIGLMRISVSEAKGQSTELVRRAEAGEEVVLTHCGRATVRLVPVQPQPDAVARRALIMDVQTSAQGKRTQGAIAARSQDFLYDDDGLPT